jgi:hypothetical protein
MPTKHVDSVALGVAYWLAQNDERSWGARVVVSGMVFYNLGAATLLGLAGIQTQSTCIFLWPAVILHSGMGVWYAASLLKKT